MIYFPFFYWFRVGVFILFLPIRNRSKLGPKVKNLRWNKNKGGKNQKFRFYEWNPRRFYYTLFSFVRLCPFIDWMSKFILNYQKEGKIPLYLWGFGEYIYIELSLGWKNSLVFVGKNRWVFSGIRTLECFIFNVVESSESTSFIKFSRVISRGEGHIIEYYDWLSIVES